MNSLDNFAAVLPRGLSSLGATLLLQTPARLPLDTRALCKELTASLHLAGTETDARGRGGHRRGGGASSCWTLHSCPKELPQTAWPRPMGMSCLAAFEARA